MLLLLNSGDVRSQPVEENQRRHEVAIQGRVITTSSRDISDAPGVSDSQILLVQLYPDGRQHVLTSGQWTTDSQGYFRVAARVSLPSILLVLTTTEDSQLHAVVDTTITPGMTVDIGRVNPATTIATDLFLQLYSAGVRNRGEYTNILASVRAELDLMNAETRFIYNPRYVQNDSTESDYPFHSLHSGDSGSEPE